jgi:hypothetical protein
VSHHMEREKSSVVLDELLSPWNGELLTTFFIEIIENKFVHPLYIPLASLSFSRLATPVEHALHLL